MKIAGLPPGERRVLLSADSWRSRRLRVDNQKWADSQRELPLSAAELG